LVVSSPRAVLESGKNQCRTNIQRTEIQRQQRVASVLFGVPVN
jgi:hypothetical protein